MQASLACYPCLVTSTLKSATKCGLNEEQSRIVLEYTLDRLLASIKNTGSNSPVAVMAGVLKKIRTLGLYPYKDDKKLSNEMALSFYPNLRELVWNKAGEPDLNVAVRVCVAGNIIDLPLYDLATIDLPRSVSSVTQFLAIDHTSALLAELETARVQAKPVLFIADNAGEVVFDRVLLEALQCNGKIPIQIWYAAKGGPATNDATIEDCIAVGIDKIPGVKLVSTGVDSQGCPIELVDKEFIHMMQEAAVIISKGQANFETAVVPGNPMKIFYLFMAKCPVSNRLHEFFPHYASISQSL